MEKPALYNNSDRYDFGSLWWCRESKMKERFSKWKDNDRTCHPVISIYKAQRKHFDLSPIPMLSGSSGMNGPVLIRGLSKERGENHPTVFGIIIKPGSFPRKDFFATLQSEIKNGRKVFANIPANVWPNHHKTKANSNEEYYLRQFCEKHGF